MKNRFFDLNVKPFFAGPVMPQLIGGVILISNGGTVAPGVGHRDTTAQPWRIFPTNN